ncbi:MAG: (d)CMP kinase [Gammaproteobacteria bacterium]|nr:MAG: (d)CMP kinase [Gammaproteobacteria bacterium]
MVPVIAIDGPGGAGKGTICRLVAGQLGWHLLDSGSLYRITAYAAEHHNIAFNDSAAVAAVARSLDVRFIDVAENTSVIFEEKDITDLIRTEKAGTAASIVAADPTVREALIDRQRGFARPPGLVADGRDMGSVVFTRAGLKIYLTASVGERARRRYKQLKDKGMDVSLPALSKDMEERDRRDSQRAVAPLRACEDARVLDSTQLDISEVVDLVISWASEVYAV